ncbi:zinc-binding alcohol dehydrogenase family protein [Bacillus altitudinis]|uniref:quinone oxidoreductase family protein n=1 Tax=Bacillus TaxID=1386 RepID=UPI000597A944|nr:MULTISPECIES: zinc-binding alcohol dehydrogenase family protein [Bacillus]KIL11132.1 Quinone oxidoreductase [Bacillus safensis]MCY7714530.1 zinc-binding alcohol dehydrogenase family protein [Bacillus altitudinis]
MKAAVINEFGAPPVLGDYPDPQTGAGEMVIDVHAAPLSPIVKSISAGKHYTSNSGTGFVPGIDGVGTDSNGRRVYFLFPKPPFGSMAKKTLVSSDSVVPVPDGVTDENAAAVVTAGLSSWVALTLRANFQRGETVLINGGTGSAGALAIQIANYFGASKIITTGRDKAKLAQLPSYVEKIPLDDHADEALRYAFSKKIDVVLDYLWGEPASRVIAAATTGRGSATGEPRLRYVQIGSIAGEMISISASSLRSSGIEILGSGIGSLSKKDLVEGAGQLLAAMPAGGFNTPVKIFPLSEVKKVWNDESNNRRIVLCP